jgi:DNA polymerase-3 subunit delta'
MVDRWGASAEEAEQLARISQGRPGWARAAMLDESLVSDRLSLADHLHGIASAPRDERLAYAQTLAQQWPAQREEIRRELDAWQAWWRDMLLVRCKRDDLVMHRERRDVLHVAAGKYETHAIVDFIEAVRRAMRQLEENANPRLVLDVMMLSVPHSTPGAALDRQEAPSVMETVPQ